MSGGITFSIIVEEEKEEEFLNRYLFFCDVKTSKCSISFIDHSFGPRRAMSYLIAIALAKDFNGCSRTIMLEDDGRVFIESNHSYDKTICYGEHKFGFKSYQPLSINREIDSQFIPQNNTDGSKSPNLVSQYKLICLEK